ncbi:amiloride-sensitive amine oxidase [copper-containing]-like [Lingula anatina]|uniref:Amine oxidase n=1 Tax=Lingula anatina TaxID=7574 RepID=A0A1S3K745_LINAN|nr:amiloride-sensitive amine oxidase [copper-containing]-like [Lingula anatina]|eukprot:XP_013418264.1 amiloride-sensitive amine oxidase [copper-containing]-like [Lingula anatina]
MAAMHERTKSYLRGRFWIWSTIGLSFLSLTLLIALVAVGEKWRELEENQQQLIHRSRRSSAETEVGKRTKRTTHWNVPHLRSYWNYRNYWNILPKYELSTPSIFDSLTNEEMLKIQRFMQQQPELNLKPVSEASMSDNYIFLMEAVLPPKSEVLDHLDRGQPMPARRARVTCFMGAKNPPVVEEFLVSPLPRVARYERVGSTISFHARPIDGFESNGMDEYIFKPITEKMFPILKKYYGYWYHNCTNRCIYFDTSARGLRAGDRQVHASAYRYGIDGYYIWPLPLQIVVNTNGNNPAAYSVTRLYFEHQSYSNVDEILDAYNSGQLKVTKLPPPPTGPTYGSPEKRRLHYGGDYRRRKRIPKQFEPDGKRYTVDGRRVKYLDWEFNVRFRALTGIQIMDVRFRGERIAYEIGIGEIAVYYSGREPTGILANFLDSGFVLGRLHFPLLKGYDCPNNAMYFDNTFYNPSGGRPHTHRSAVCLFEHNTGIPVRRHYLRDYTGPDISSFNYQFSLPGTVLILRGIITLFNYDYVLDYVFHPNGVIETKVSSTGYVFSITNPKGESSPYGYNINTENGILAPLHHHMFNFKVDLDIGGIRNRFETWDLKLESLPNPLAPGDRWIQKRLERNLRRNEQDALIKYNFDEPKYYVMYNAGANNSLGYPRGYRIYSNGFSKKMLPDGWSFENGISWARQQVAVLKQKDSEDTTASLFNQADPYNPTRNFADFHGDNESIVDQDLVAWVTVGIHHIPVAEDIPVTTTPGKELSIFLTPLNYYDEDPSMTSCDATVVRP